MAQSVRGRQGCRPLRWWGVRWCNVPPSVVGYDYAPMRWATVPGTAKRPPSATPSWGGDGGLTALPWGLRHLRMALRDDGGFRPLRRAGVSRRARRGNFARCGGRPKALPLETAIWATRRRLARGVGEEFCVRARPSFAAILDVWQEAGPQLWRKRPGDTRSHTGGKLPHRKKSSKTFIFWCFGGKNGRAAEAARPPLCMLYCILE